MRFSTAIGAVIILFWFAGVPVANAFTQNITAVFRADPSKPNASFINTTPVSGHCAQYPAQCQAGNMSSVRLPVRFSGAMPVSGEPRRNAMFKVPAQWRTVNVVHADSGKSEIVEIRVVGIGSRYQLSDTAEHLVGENWGIIQAHQRLWGDQSWLAAPTPCQYGGVTVDYDAHSFSFFWKTPVEQVCRKRASFPIPLFTYNYLDVAYELRTPSPAKMLTGHYTGSLTLGIGPGQDFDMGDVMLPNDSALTLNFDLEVQHILKVEIPPGGNRVELVPQEGWQAWLNHGQRPTRIFRDQPFFITASSRFKMRIECSNSNGNNNSCNVVSPTQGAQLIISVTLPAGLTDATGAAVIRRRLWRDGTGTELFQPASFIDRRQGMLHFEVRPDQVALILASGQKKFFGTVIVIWDSEV